MPLTKEKAIDQTRAMLEVRNREKSERLDRIHDYLVNQQTTVWLPASVPVEVREIVFHPAPSQEPEAAR